MNNLNTRNILLVIGAIVVVILGMNILSTLIGAVIPIGITAVIAFILGRLSANRNLLDLARSASAGVSTVTGKVAEMSKPASQPAAKPEAEKEKPAATPELKNPELLDPNFDIKTPEEIEAEARRLEAEVSKKTTAYDPKAAIEERKKRLLGDKGDQI
jgi:hypothetical protein